METRCTRPRHSLIVEALLRSSVAAFGQRAKLFKTSKQVNLLAGWRFHGIIFFAMQKELNPQQALAVHCPTCGAPPGEKCELSTGKPRNQSHRDRRVIAKELTKTPTVATNQRTRPGTEEPRHGPLGDQPNCERY
jgi:hypothetical protein